VAGAGGRPAGELTFAGAVVERPGEIADLDIDTGKDRMLIRYKTPPGSFTTALTTLDSETLRYGPTIEVDGHVTSAVSRRGDRIVAGTMSGVVVYDGDSGKVLGTIDDPDLRAVVVTVADQLFVGSLGGELTQYDLETLEPIRTFGGSRGLLFGGAGTADGSLLAVSGGDRVAALYDVASGVQLGGPITIASDERSAVRLSVDGRWLAVGGQPTAVDDVVDDGRSEPRGAQIWDLDPASWTRAACRVAGRDLTRDEWAAHIGDLAPYRSTCPS
jgi:WD40 repeat protein